MYRWIESIALENGSLKNIEYHQERLERTLRIVKGDVFSLNDIFYPLLANYSNGLYKARIVYNAHQVVAISISPYVPRELSTFQLIEATTIKYSYKREDRSCFDLLKKNINADEIIITQGGFITDTSYSNLVFLKDGEWFTPNTYLLAGTQRQSLLDKGIIKEAKLSVDNLTSFSHFKLINSMLDFHRSPSYPILAISK